MKHTIRPLTPPESALTFCNAQAPMVTVIAIRFKGILEEETVAAALQKLQDRHPLLRARIVEDDSGYAFEYLDPLVSIGLQTVVRDAENTWKAEVERALNTSYDTSGPLMRGVLVKSQDGFLRGEMLLVFHHSIIDGISARLLLLDFLRLVGGQKLRSLTGDSAALTHTYPPSSHGFLKKLRFMGRQMGEEIAFLLRGGRHRPPTHSENAVISLRFGEKDTHKITAAAGRAGVTLNSLIGAAMVHALAAQTDSAVMRAIAFADLRPRMVPPVSAHELGCYFSMVRFSLRLKDQQTVMDSAKALWEHMFAAGKKGDLFLYSMMSEQVLRMTWRFKKMRMADTALSYIGTLNAEKKYGDIEIEDIGAFITNNRFGPKITAFGMCLFGKLGIDMNYLTAEFDEATAVSIGNRIEELLKSCQ